MGKFNWQNGTLVTPARVEIGGEVYDVTPEQYSGQTPLSAENLNQMQDGIYSDIGNKESLATTNKDSLVSAINETVVESITNANGTAIKYSNGIMICSSSVTFNEINIVAFGELFRSVSINFNDFPVSFTELFSISYGLKALTNISNGASIIQIYMPTTSNPGNISLLLNSNTAKPSGTITYIAIGKWK